MNELALMLGSCFVILIGFYARTRKKDVALWMQERRIDGIRKESISAVPIFLIIGGMLFFIVSLQSRKEKPYTATETKISTAGKNVVKSREVESVQTDRIEEKGKIYKFTDDNGVIVMVDELAKVPEKYRQTVKSF